MDTLFIYEQVSSRKPLAWYFDYIFHSARPLVVDSRNASREPQKPTAGTYHRIYDLAEMWMKDTHTKEKARHKWGTKYHHEMAFDAIFGRVCFMCPRHERTFTSQKNWEEKEMLSLSKWFGRTIVVLKLKKFL